MPPVPGGHRHRRPRSLLSCLSLLLGATLLLLSPAQGSSAFEPWWVQNHQETQLWSGPDAQAILFGRVPQWSYFQVVAPQKGSRLYVLNPQTGGFAYIDAAAVGPSAPPPTASPAILNVEAAAPLRRAPEMPPGFQGWWVSNFEETEMWSGPGGDAISLGRVPQFRRFLVVEPQQGERLKVWSPETEQTGYVDVSVLGPSGPSVWLAAMQVKLVRQVYLPGRSMGNKSYVRNLPVYDDETELRHAPHNTRLQIREMVVAPDGSEWYTVDGGGYIRAAEVRLPRPVSTIPTAGRWIDADLEEPALLTAYEGDRAVYSAMAIKGFTATPTLRGTFQILRRVENETMDSETIGIPRNGPGGYYLKNVLYTQYFTHDGASLHYNYWLGTFGYPGSHGCLGLSLEDARWFWDWATVGTPVIIR